MRHDGCMKSGNKDVYLSVAPGKTTVGLAALAENAWRVWFCDLPVRDIDVERRTPRWLAQPSRQSVSHILTISCYRWPEPDTRPGAGFRRGGHLRLTGARV